MSKVKPLIDGTGYEGLYVATASFNDRRVIASGSDAGEVWRKAQAQGVGLPVLMYVPTSKGKENQDNT